VCVCVCVFAIIQERNKPKRAPFGTYTDVSLRQESDCNMSIGVSAYHARDNCAIAHNQSAAAPLSNPEVDLG
jgi:hypothetical protein